MRSRLYAAVAVALVMWLSWLFRYDPSGGHGIILDRWTGDAVMPILYERRPLGDIPIER